MRPIDDVRGVWLFAAAAALLVLLVGVTYLPLRHNDFVNFDDDQLILDNPILRDLSRDSLGPIFERQLFTPHYKPLVYLSWAVELRLFGPDPRAFHRHNLALHLLNSLLVLAVVARLCPRRTDRRWRIALAAAVAAIWALHPLKVESVAWASERKDVLFAAFYLGAMWNYLGWVEGRRRLHLALSVLLFLGGVISKSTAITLPAALLLIDLARGRHPDRGLLLEKLPHLAVALLALFLYGMLPGPGGAGTALPLIAAHAPLQRLAEAGHRHLAFAAHWLAPTDLAPLYPVPELLERVRWTHLAGLAAAHLLLVAVLLALLRRDRRAAAALLFFSCSLLPPMVAPISTTNYLSDRYTYLPSLGLSVLAVIAATALGRRLPRARPALAAFGLAILALLATLTWRQVGVWRDSERLWSHNLAAQPPHAYAYNNRGAARLAQGDRAGALADFDRAIAALPRYGAALANRADLRRRAGDLDAALLDAQAAVAAEPLNGPIYRARGNVLADLDRLADALADYDRALELDPGDLEALFLRAQVHRRAGHLPDARRDINAVLHAPGASADHHLLRALIRAEQGDLSGAVTDTGRALELDPASPIALNNRGFLRLRLGQPALALQDLDRALELRPAYALANRSRGDALAALGRPAEACAAWRLAARGRAPATAERLTDCPPQAPSADASSKPVP